MPQTFRGHIEAVAYGGDGIIHHHGQTIFIPNTVAGDKALYQVTDKKRGVWRAEVIKLLAPAQDRIKPPCMVANACGGCSLQYMHLAAQTKLKTSWVLDAFKPFITKATVFAPLKQEHKPGFAGRRRVRWFRKGDKLGFYQRFSHHVVHSDTCIALSKTLDTLRKELEEMALPSTVASIQAVELSNGIHIILESEHDCPDGFIPSIAKDQQWWWRKRNSPAIQALHKPVLTLFDNINLHPFKHETLNIQIGANDFVQGHQQGNQALVSQVLEWCQGSKRVVDLFSGCGNLSLPVAAALDARVVGAELNPASVKAANNNAKRLNLHATYQTLDLFKTFAIEPFVGADTLILDPPRKGAKRICQHINQLFPKQIIMVNCNLAAAKRDANALANAGFTLKALRPLDLFPYSGHVETLSLWAS